MKLIRVIDANYIDEYKIRLSFNDGTIGIVNLKDEIYGNIFEPLKEIEYFKNFKLDTWTLCWPNGADLSPEFLYELALKSQPELVKK